MADAEERVETSARGNEWEVVSLTASTYAAAPSVKQLESELCTSEEESARAIFMSDLFVFPPSQHENLPIEPNISEIDNEPRFEGIDPMQDCADAHMETIKNKDKVWDIQGLSQADELAFRCAEFEEEKILQARTFSASKFTSFDGEAESSFVSKPIELFQLKLDPPDLSVSPEPDKGKDKKGGLPCEAWWKRHATSLYTHAKEANAFWSVVVAAALTGLVILGQRWQQEKWHLQQLKWQFGNERMKRMLGPVLRLKDILVSDQRRVPFIRGRASAEH